MNPDPPSSRPGVSGYIRRRGGISPSVTLAVSISTLVRVAVLAVLGIGPWSATQNTMSLLRDKADLMVPSTIAQVPGQPLRGRDATTEVFRLL